jgi:hypothetical protein
LGSLKLKKDRSGLKQPCKSTELELLASIASLFLFLINPPVLTAGGQGGRGDSIYRGRNLTQHIKDLQKPETAKGA